MRLETMTDGWRLSFRGRVLLEHREQAPFLYVGRGVERMDMYRGNFHIEDYVIERIGLHEARIAATPAGYRVECAHERGGAMLLALEISCNEQRLMLKPKSAAAGLNRFWLRLAAEENERVWGCGEQMSYFNLRGRHFPLWTSEPGVGRDKTTAITFQADVTGKAGGDYYTTNYPQPTFVSSRRYYAHVETSAYADFDFRHPDFHELQIWTIPEEIEIVCGDAYLDIIEALSERFGRQPELPEWIYRGAIVGLKDGERSFERLQTYRDAGVCVSGLWCEDWAGVRQTSFGTRLFWDWRWNELRYPNLPERIAQLARDNIRFLAYVNPYLCVDGSLFPEAESLGLLARTADGATYTVDFGEFECGVVDFTHPQASAWFADRVIRRNMIELGVSGWMADFGEYLPIDVQLADGSDARVMHNAWPTQWAKVNAKAIAAAGRTSDCLFFMRAGYTGVQRHCPLLWAGDQSVDFSRHDGLVTVICGALSSGMLGNAFHHSDIGGYTSLFGNTRTPELIQRWAEMAAFTPVMRTHEGNRPRDNLQIDQDETVLRHFARMTRIYRHLAPYLRALSQQASARGWPVQRPLFVHFEHDVHAYDIQDQYLYGPDLLIAPVHAAGAQEWSAYLPQGEEWEHLWSGRRWGGGRRVSVPAPLGEPPVFVRIGSPHHELFAGLRSL